VHLIESAAEILFVSTLSVHQMVESVIGCKWSLTVIDLVRHGVHRPGAMEHAIDGPSAKVLNERLVKLVRFGILEKTSYPEVPPRVEYNITAFGREFAQLLDQWINWNSASAHGHRNAGADFFGAGVPCPAKAYRQLGAQHGRCAIRLRSAR